MSIIFLKNGHEFFMFKIKFFYQKIVNEIDMKNLVVIKNFEDIQILLILKQYLICEILLVFSS